MTQLTPDLLERAARVRLACFDVDGTLTDGRLFYDAEGRESKAFHVLDGQGLKLLEENGVAVAFITARRNAAIQARARDLGLQHVYTGVKDKGAVLLQLCESLELSLEEAAHMGDDLPDLPALMLAGLSAAVDVSAVILKTGAAASIRYVDGVAVVVKPIGGVMLEAALGAVESVVQQFPFMAA